MRNFLLYILILFCVIGCSVQYSLSGASISPDVKTFSVAYISNQAPKKQPTLSDIFTDGLKDKFRSNAGLSLVSKNGDLQFEGSITDYSISYQGVTADKTAAQNRLTITISIKFINTKDPKKNFDKKFSAYQDYPKTESLSDVETSLIQTISDEIINDIFMEAVANW